MHWQIYLAENARWVGADRRGGSLGKLRRKNYLLAAAARFRGRSHGSLEQVFVDSGEQTALIREYEELYGVTF